MSSPSDPKVLAVIVESKTIAGNFSMRAVKNQKQVPIQMILKDSGFVPGDLVEIRLKDSDEEYIIKELELKVENLEDEVRYLEDKISDAIYKLEG